MRPKAKNQRQSQVIPPPESIPNKDMEDRSEQPEEKPSEQQSKAEPQPKGLTPELVLMVVFALHQNIDTYSEDAMAPFYRYELNNGVEIGTIRETVEFIRNGIIPPVILPIEITAPIAPDPTSGAEEDPLDPENWDITPEEKALFKRQAAADLATDIRLRPEFERQRQEKENATEQARAARAKKMSDYEYLPLDKLEKQVKEDAEENARLLEEKKKEDDEIFKF